MSSGLSSVPNEKKIGLSIVVGRSGTGKTALLRKWAGRHGYSYLNIGSLVSRRMIEYSPAERSDAVQHEFRDAVESAEGDVVLCDNIELLFAPELSLDPLRLLKQAARRKTVVAAWDGSYDGSTLSYAVPGHDEYWAYSHTDVQGVILLPISEANAL
ncbi:BREX-3 system P-loop-containing protein BrxF [Methanoculleus sp. 10]|uniref:BREX-3 system P-loop-containing protein BrxF n=1 Tax=Methanoculleus sp. 10 TaxID=430615 RepID=UPI0025F8BBF3|nr:BREX-3 system P-loop-containing protein BrxF [Methanoculleus sp. 10]